MGQPDLLGVVGLFQPCSGGWVHCRRLHTRTCSVNMDWLGLTSQLGMFPVQPAPLVSLGLCPAWLLCALWINSGVTRAFVLTALGRRPMERPWHPRGGSAPQGPRLSSEYPAWVWSTAGPGLLGSPLQGLALSPRLCYFSQHPWLNRAHLPR